MTTQRGYKLSDDVKSRRRFTVADLQGVNLEVTHETLLAVWFFLSQHADRCAFVIVSGGNGGNHDDEKGDNRGG